MRSTTTERGQAAPLLTACVVVAALAVTAFAQLGARAADAARARTAADAAALAGVLDGPAGAARLAAANGAVLESFAVVAGDVVVRVRVGDAFARARATLSPDPPP
jgi:hypothetical protein